MCGIVGYVGKKQAAPILLEGLSKLESIPALLQNGDFANYVIEVHALKSSSAAIGAAAMSVLFRELEFAGKADNREYINSHTDSVLSQFRDVLEKVRVYLETNGIFESGTDVAEPEGEMVEFDDGIIDELIDSLSRFNIKETEEKVAEHLGVNYGSEVNHAFAEINSQLEVFDYHKAKELLMELKRRRNESGI